MPDMRLVVFAILLPALVLATAAVAVVQGADLNHLDDAPPGAQLALYGQAFLPAVAALVAWGGPRGFPWGFRRTSWRHIGVAFALPALGVGLAYGIAWLTGLTQVRAGGVFLPGVLLYLVLAVGEQLGWSSFLVTRLNGAPLVVGLAWAAFHYPLMLFVPGAVRPGVPTPWALLWFTVEAVALAFPMVALRLRTGSIWPVLVLHTTLNSALYLVAEPLTKGSARWLGEGGALTSIAIVIVVVATRTWWRPSQGEKS